MAPLINPLASAKRIVVKIGSALLDAATGSLRIDWLTSLAADTADQKKRGRDVLVVSSGSIALGRRVLGLPEGELSLDLSQAAAAVGQIRLARASLVGNPSTASTIISNVASSPRRADRFSRSSMIFLKASAARSESVWA